MSSVRIIIKLDSKHITKIEKYVKLFINSKHLSKNFVKKYNKWGFSEKYYFLTQVVKHNLLFKKISYYDEIKKKLFTRENNIKLKNLLFFVKLRQKKKKITKKSIKEFLFRNRRYGYISLLYKFSPKKFKGLILEFLKKNR